LHGGLLECINECHPTYLSLHYVLLFPYGEFGWHSNIPHVTFKAQQTYVAQMNFFSYCLFSKTNEYCTILRVGKLTHEFIVNVWATIEQARLCWVQMNQRTLRIDGY
jgi:hypothetical protein